LEESPFLLARSSKPESCELFKTGRMLSRSEFWAQADILDGAESLQVSGAFLPRFFKTRRADQVSGYEFLNT
jgi:hypothetical protein